MILLNKKYQRDEENIFSSGTYYTARTKAQDKFYQQIPIKG